MAAMRGSARCIAVFYVQVIAGKRAYALDSRCLSFSRLERQTMMNSKHVVSMLRRDALFVWHAVIAVVFICFAGLAVGAAFVDFVAIPN
jgi:hypothetical protein